MPQIISPFRLDTQRSAVLLVDLQDRLCDSIPDIKNVIDRAKILTTACDQLEVVRAATVQYPEGLGPLVPTLLSDYPDAEAKRDFSAAACRIALDTWHQEGRDQIILVGIETHICIMQTAMDLLAEGFKIHVVVDAVTSRNKIDHETALLRLRELGVTLISLESVLFEWLGSSRHTSFKAISQLVKEMNCGE
ncbi:isochorismatase family protein [Rhodopirellula sp.]|nr:isochorismatase family protein [Rhodopirellula sp.]MDB4678745.1 isochorismatase family protein [Rhodopirellula sp.]MDB4809824.1 isochorismatase family protein [bacterium]